MENASPPSPRFDLAVARLLKTEGGFVNHPKDPGGATNFGISLRFLLIEGRIDANHDRFADFDLDMDGDIDVADIRKLTHKDAEVLYRRCFWDRLGCEGFARPLGEMLFDQAVNGGIGAAVKILQRAINFASGVDGAMGAQTRAAVQRVLAFPAKGMPALVVAYREMAKARYRSLVKGDPILRVFLKGWLARADQLGRD
jgi:lysozyme family protein